MIARTIALSIAAISIAILIAFEFTRLALADPQSEKPRIPDLSRVECAFVTPNVTDVDPVTGMMRQ